MNSGSRLHMWRVACELDVNSLQSKHTDWILAFHVIKISPALITSCWLRPAPATLLSVSKLWTTVAHKYNSVHPLKTRRAFPSCLHPSIPSSCSRHTRDAALGPAAVCSLVSRAKCCLLSVAHAPTPNPHPTPHPACLSFSWLAAKLSVSTQLVSTVSNV